LRASLAEAQQIYLQVSMGSNAEAMSYTQGDGTRSITFTRANLGQLIAAIQEMQAQLGIVVRPRKAFRLNLSRR
jgi:hypothetical protein